MQSSNLIDKLLNIGIITGIGVGGYFFVTKMFKKIDKEATEAKLGTSKEGQQAVALRSAFNPSGVRFLMGMDGTNNKGVFATAKEIRNFAEVAKAYRSLYSSDLSTDLTNELSAKELKEFWDLVNNAGKIKAGDKIKTKTGTIELYKAPENYTRSFVKRINVAEVTFLPQVTRWSFKNIDGTTGVVIFNKIKVSEGEFWVKNTQLNLPQ